jgi:hypothetical protein
MHFKSLGDHVTTMFTVFLFTEHATLSFEAYFAWRLHFDRADFVLYIFIVYIFDFLKEITV